MDKILAKVGTLTVTEKEVDDFLVELGEPSCLQDITQRGIEVEGTSRD